jgi:RNA polymerase sigma-70 factor (ECF subfamily)
VTVSIDDLQPDSISGDVFAQTSFDQLFQAHWERVYAVVFRIVGDPAEAEDLALEAFWKLYRAAWVDNPTGWLYRVATNLALNALRDGDRRADYERKAGKIRLQASGVNPADEAERAEQRAQVRQVLGEMKPRAAKILVLRYSGLSYKQIAAAVRVSPNSVGTLLSRAEETFERRYRALEER